MQPFFPSIFRLLEVTSIHVRRTGQGPPRACRRCPTTSSDAFKSPSSPAAPAPGCPREAHEHPKRPQEHQNVLTHNQKPNVFSVVHRFIRCVTILSALETPEKDNTDNDDDDDDGDDDDDDDDNDVVGWQRGSFWKMLFGGTCPEISSGIIVGNPSGG